MEMLSPEVEARIRALAITARPQHPRPQLRTSPYHEQALSAIFLCKLLFAIGAKYCLIYEDDWLSVCDSLEYALQANNATYQSGATDATFVTLEPQIRRLVEILQRYSPQTIIPASLSDTSSFMLEARIADGDQRTPRTQIGGLETKVTFVFLNSPWFRQDPGEDIRFVHVWLPSQFCYAEIVWALHSVQACNVKENAHFYTYAPDDLESFPFALSQIYPTLGPLSLPSEIIYVLTDRTSPIYIAGEAYGNVWKMNGRVVLKDCSGRLQYAESIINNVTRSSADFKRVLDEEFTSDETGTTAVPARSKLRPRRRAVLAPAPVKSDSVSSFGRDDVSILSVNTCNSFKSRMNTYMSPPGVAFLR